MRPFLLGCLCNDCGVTESRGAVLFKRRQDLWLGCTDEINEFTHTHFCILTAVEWAYIHPLARAVVPVTFFLQEAATTSGDLALFACSIVHSLVPVVTVGLIRLNTQPVVVAIQGRP